MTKKKVQLFIDLGNSETRGIVKAGLEAGETPIHYSFSRSNGFAHVRDADQLAEAMRGDYNNLTSTAFNFELAELVKNLKGIHVSGDIAERNYEGAIRASVGSRPKYEQYKVYLAITKAIDTALQWLTQFSKKSLTKAQIAEQVDFHLVVLVPPKQVVKATEKFTEVFKDKGVSYTDVFTDDEIKVQVGGVTVLPEGLAAYIAASFSYSKKQPRQLISELASKRVIILDIGAGTTDMVAVDKGELMDLVKTTIPIGGNNIINLTQMKFNDANTSNLSNVIFKDVLVDPTIMWGDKQIDVSKYVEIAMGEVADSIVAGIRDFFQSQNIDISTFNSLMIVGGGAMRNSLTQSISELIFEALEDDLPEISLIDTSKIKEPKFQDSELELDSLRTLNLLGALTYQAMKEM